MLNNTKQPMKTILFFFLKHFLLLGILSIFTITSCVKEDSEEKVDTPAEKVLSEVSVSQTFYNSNGGQFKFRVYNLMEDMVNWHEASVRRLIVKNDKFSVLSSTFVPWISGSTNYTMAVNIQGQTVDLSHLQNRGYVSNIEFYDPIEITQGDTIYSWSYTDYYLYGIYGHNGGKFHNQTINGHSGPFQSSNSNGHMCQFNGKHFILSMGLNSFSGKPALYQYDPVSYQWNGTILQFILDNGFPISYDASKLNFNHKIAWAWTSYGTTYTDGKLNFVWFDGQDFSQIYSQNIGPVATGNSIGTIFVVRIYENAQEPEKPYFSVAKTNGYDFYKFNGTGMDLIASDVTLPQSSYGYRPFVFYNNKAYLITGNDPSLWHLNGNTFESFGQNLINGKNVTAISAASDGIYIAISQFFQREEGGKCGCSDVVRLVE